MANNYTYGFNHTYDFEDYLSQIPDYKRKDSDALKNRASTVANLVYDPQRSEQERQAKWNEMQQINKMQQLKASNAGVEESLAYNNSQAKKAAAIRSASAGAVGSSGLNEYLKNQADASTEAQRLNVAAILAQNKNAAINEYSLIDRQTQDKLAEIEDLRGRSAANLYEEYEAAQDTAENDWKRNALNVALGIGEGNAAAADLNLRKNIEDNRIAAQLYEATLPYRAMTQNQIAQLDLDTAKAFGKTTKSNQKNNYGSSGSKAATLYVNDANSHNLRDVASRYGFNVGYDAQSGNVTVGNKVYSPQTLAAMGGFISNGRWQLPSSSINSLLTAAK